jgi:predicted ribosome quality control (RQC) complex YloA/Tae2 family protein
MKSLWRTSAVFSHRCCSSEVKVLPGKEWSIATLQKETIRQHYRAVKKLNTMSAKTLTDGEECQLNDKKEKLMIKVQGLLTLETHLKTIKSLTKTDPHYHDIIKQAKDLQLYNLADTRKPSVSVKKTPKKTPGSRQIFYAYLSSDNIPIHVGKQAEDNDELSCNPKYRSDNEWWMHADGCAGSHVVIKSTDDDIARKFSKTVSDAAILAAFRSKNKAKSTCDVKITRCKHVKKIPGSPAGQVMLTDIFGKKIKVNMKKSLSRFQTLESERISRQ